MVPKNEAALVVTACAPYSKWMLTRFWTQITSVKTGSNQVVVRVATPTLNARLPHPCRGFRRVGVRQVPGTRKVQETTAEKNLEKGSQEVHQRILPPQGLT